MFWVLRRSIFSDKAAAFFNVLNNNNNNNGNSTSTGKVKQYELFLVCRIYFKIYYKYSYLR